jgi:CubicO group peptidase (beta-lactamase class C family)
MESGISRFLQRTILLLHIAVGYLCIVIGSKGSGVVHGQEPTAATPGRPRVNEVVANGTVKGELATKIDQRLSRLAEGDFSGVVLAAQGGIVILGKGYGYADRAAKLPFTTETVFDIGSITKPFTAAAILKLEMTGKLTVTDPIMKYLRDVPEDKQQITLHQLLTHTAGFTDSLGDDYDKVGREDFVKLALASKLRSRPGKSYSYSNVGYSLLGVIIKRVTEQSYEKYLHDNLFKPAGMMKTGYVIPEWGNARLAHGYQKTKDWGTPLDHAWNQDGPYWHLRANGGLLSTVDDLYRWSVALRGDGILSKKAKEKHFAPHVSEGFLSGGTHYGYGWSIGGPPHERWTPS